MAVSLIAYKLVEFNYFKKSLSTELAVLLIAILFTAVGIWAGIKYGGSSSSKLVYKSNQNVSEDLNISKREYEVLELLATGLSNQEIANKLFVSLPTIKTHSSNLYSKLSVKRRSQAVEKARTLGILEIHTKG